MDNIQKRQAAAAAALGTVLLTGACGAPSPRVEAAPEQHQVVDYGGLKEIVPDDVVSYVQDTISIPRSVMVRRGTEAGLPPTGDPIIFHSDNTKMHKPILLPNGGKADGPNGPTSWICGNFQDDALGLGIDILPVRNYGCVFLGRPTGIEINSALVGTCVVQQVAPKYLLCRNGHMVGRVSQDEVPNKDPNNDPKPTLTPPKSLAGGFKPK